MALSTPWLPTVSTLQDGSTASAETVNPIIEQLVQRDQYLYDQIGAIQDKSALLAFGLPIYPGDLAPSPTAFNPSELSLVYYRNDTGGAGLSRAKIGFATDPTNSNYTPNDSNYIFGLIADLASSSTMDVYLEGYVTTSVNLDDPTYGLIAPNESLVIGPYYLSRTFPGKVTSNPSGLPVFVGYAISDNQFLLRSNVEDFTELFINYRFPVLARPTGTPILSGSGTWTIPVPDMTRLGWVPTSALPGSYVIPPGALFYYNVPSAYTTDNADNSGSGSLTVDEKTYASELASLLPPSPSNFINLLVNGVVQQFNSENNTNGIYSVDQYGLWWYKNENGLQPWASDLPNTWTPAQWLTNPGSAYLAPYIYITFAKFNPALRTQLVSSLTPYNAADNNSTNAIELLNKYSPTQSATQGDLLIRYNLPINITSTSGVTTLQAVTSLAYSQSQGRVNATVSPVISTITGTGAVSVTENPVNSGNWILAYNAQGLAGEVTSVEPINTRLKFLGLNSYLNLPATLNNTYGFIGKTTLPKNFPSSLTFRIYLHAFGSTSYTSSATAITFGLQFSYAITTAQNGAAPSGVIAANNLVSAASTIVNAQTPLQADPTIITASFTPQGTAYTANTPFYVSPVEFTIPASVIGEDSIVNFQVTRAAVSSNIYPGDLNILTSYWSLGG